MWFQVALFVVSLVLAWLLRPEAPKQDGPTELDPGPTAEEGDVIPVLFGTRDIEGINVVWYGDTRIVAVKKKGGKK